MAIKTSPVIADRIGTSPATKSSSRAAAIAAGANAGNRSSTSGSGSTLRVSGSEPFAKLGPQSVMDLINKKGTVGTNQQGPLKTGYVTASQAQAAANQTLANRISAATPAGQIVVSEPTGPAGGGGGAGGGGAGGAGGGGAGGNQTPTEEASAASKIDAAAALQALINQLLEVDYLGFQGEQAAELRRLQNLRNQLYGDAEFGTTGSVQRQQQLDTAARRRLAASRAVAGMLGGGAYAGTERGLGTIQRAEQDVALQELQRPFIEQTAADRLREFGLTFTPENRVFDLYNFNRPEDLMGGWAAETFAGRQAAARARLAALEQLRQRGIQL